MNKKLFSWKALAGVALLAAFSMTSCTSDDPIDPTNPSGINPTAARHQVGGDYDWTVAANDVAELNKFWAEDKAAVQKLVGDKKVASICIIADNFKLDGTTIDIPDLWADANGKIVKVYVSGNFKNPDFLRADFIKNGAKATKFPVKIDTKNVAGSEVQFTFDGEDFDLELETEKTRSLLNGTFEIGYFYANAAKGMSATEVQSGLVLAIDYASGAKGGIKEKEDALIAGVWSQDGTALNVEAGKGIPVGADKYIYAEDVFVENSVTINNLDYNSDAKKTFKLGDIIFVKDNADVTVTFAKKKVYAESIVGVKAAKNFITFDDATFDASNIDDVANVTIKGAMTLKKDNFTGVVFNDKITFNTNDITSFADVTFNALEVLINADNVTVSFDKVNFLAAPTLSSTMKYTYTEAGYNPTTYQWIIDDKDPTKGHYEKCKNDLSDLKEYNKGKDIAEYTTAEVQWDGTDNFKAGTDKDKSAEAKTYAVVVIKTPYAAGTYTLTPEGTLVDLASTCKFLGKTDDDNLNNIWGKVMFKDEGAWYTVKYGDTTYTWRKINNTWTYVLVK